MTSASLPDHAIHIANLNKTYKATKKQPAKTALQDVSLTIPRGSMFGLLGPNGAGKSTMINILAGLVIKSSGTVKVWDIDLDQDARNARAAIGIVPQEVTFDPFFTPRQMLDIQAGLYGVPKDRRRTMEILEMVGLADKADAYSRSLSGGMRRRLMVAKAMVHAPPILVLDEPTAGVDIELRQQLWANVREMNKRGVTILLTTHYLEEAQELCDQIAIINHGRVITSESTDSLLSRIEGKEIRFRLDRMPDVIPEGLKAYQVEKAGQRSLIIRYNPAEQSVEAMIAAIHAAGHQIADIQTDDSDLEDVFLQLTRGAA